MKNIRINGMGGKGSGQTGLGKWQLFSKEDLEKIKSSLFDDFTFRSGEKAYLDMVNEIDMEIKKRRDEN